YTRVEFDLPLGIYGNMLVHMSLCNRIDIAFPLYPPSELSIGLEGSQGHCPIPRMQTCEIKVKEQ
ncbi:hypothetical protein Dimus_035279, partial [Dionaea muscipula]